MIDDREVNVGMESGVNVYVIGGKREQGDDKIIERKQKKKKKKIQTCSGW